MADQYGNNVHPPNANQGEKKMDDIAIIHAYTRADAIADGFLIDVTNMAIEAGFRYPVALTETVWNTCVEVDPGCTHQDEQGRLWDVLMLLRFAICRDTDTSIVSFRIHHADGAGRKTETSLKAICGPGDTAEPVITIMLPDED